MAALIAGAVNSASKGELLSDYYEPVSGLWREAPLTPKIAAGSYKKYNGPKILDTKVASFKL